MDSRYHKCRFLGVKIVTNYFVDYQDSRPDSQVHLACVLQVQNIHLKAVFRVIFKPLVEELPGFGAITYSIRKKASLTFNINQKYFWWCTWCSMFRIGTTSSSCIHVYVLSTIDTILHFFKYFFLTCSLKSGCSFLYPPVAVSTCI